MHMQPALDLLKLLTLLCTTKLINGQQIEALGALRRNVFDKYVAVIPLCKTTPMHLKFQWSLYAIVRVDDRDEVIYVIAWYNIWWTDCALAWKLADYNVTSAEFPMNLRLWTPQLTWMQRISSVDAYEFSDGLFSGARMIVEHTGQVAASRELFMRSFCQLQILYFPFDTQTCNMTFTAWQVPINLMMFQNITAKANFKDLIPSDTWAVVQIPIIPKNSSIYANGSKTVYSQMVISLVIARKPLFYVFYLMLPFFVISTLNCFVFLIPPQEQEKVIFSLSILLSLCVYMMLMIDITPAKAQIPLISGYFFMVFALSVVSGTLIVFVEVMYAHHSLHAPPNWMCLLFVHGLGKYKFFRLVPRLPPHDSTDSSQRNAKYSQDSFLRRDADSLDAPKSSTNDPLHINEWRQISFATDRLFFLVYTSVSVTVYLVLIIVGVSQQTRVKS